MLPHQLLRRGNRAVHVCAHYSAHAPHASYGAHSSDWLSPGVVVVWVGPPDIVVDSVGIVPVVGSVGVVVAPIVGVGVVGVPGGVVVLPPVVGCIIIRPTLVACAPVVGVGVIVVPAAGTAPVIVGRRVETTVATIVVVLLGVVKRVPGVASAVAVLNGLGEGELALEEVVALDHHVHLY